MSTSAPAAPPTDGGSGQLHALAATAAQNINELATGLAHAGAAPAAVAQLTQMSQKLVEVVKVLAEGPSIDQASQEGPPGAGAPSPGGPSGGAPAPGGPPPSGAGPEAQGPPPGPHQALGAATDQLHQAMIASAQRGAQPPPR